jgi:hypothetical protein
VRYRLRCHRLGELEQVCGHMRWRDDGPHS